MNEFLVKDDPRSLHKPGWLSTSRTVCSMDESFQDLEEKYVYVRTHKAIYNRVLVIKEARTSFTVRFLQYDRKSKTHLMVSEMIQKRDVLDFRVFVDW